VNVVSSSLISDCFRSLTDSMTSELSVFHFAFSAFNFAFSTSINFILPVKLSMSLWSVEVDTMLFGDVDDR